MDTGRGYMSGLDLLSVNCPGGQCNRAWSYPSLSVVMLIVQINYKSISSQGIVKSSPPTKKKNLKNGSPNFQKPLFNSAKSFT